MSTSVISTGHKEGRQCRAHGTCLVLSRRRGNHLASPSKPAVGVSDVIKIEKYSSLKPAHRHNHFPNTSLAALVNLQQPGSIVVDRREQYVPWEGQLA